MYCTRNNKKFSFIFFHRINTKIFDILTLETLAFDDLTIILSWNYGHFVRRHDATDDILNDENALGRKRGKKSARREIYFFP